jgi:tRNA(Arg) A34 adenosine deaminase TadA/glycerol-3-phosphate cytidylyltransferase-like family protein
MYNRKIISFREIIKKIEPSSATLIGSSFDPFNFYYRHILKWASEQSRPLIVIVHSDDTVMARKGFILPNENQFKRAKNVSELEFVDWVIISKRLAHDPWCLRLIRPKFVIFQHDNPKYLRKLFQVLSKRFPKIIFKAVPFKKKVNSSFGKDFLDFSKSTKYTGNKIAKRLIALSRKSDAPIGKISAILTKNGKIISQKFNSIDGRHAETLILEKTKLSENFNDYILYTLIPPCIMCAEAIVRSKIKRVYYLHNYGDKLGVEYLKNNKVVVKKYRKCFLKKIKNQ